ncbi:MAG: PAS domain S-box protein [Dehalococcoidia bacterium]|nr:PAS domain S-box protein [Dehalococcoidia bacterium]
MTAKYTRTGGGGDTSSDTGGTQVEPALSEHEARLQTLFDTMIEGVVLIARDGRIMEANAAAGRILGLRRSEIIGRNYISPDWRILRPDGTSMPTEETPGLRAMKERRPIRDAVMGVERPEGTIVWIRVNASPVLNARGEVDGVVATVADITESRRTEEKHRMILDTALDGFGIIDLDGRPLEFNESYCRMVGYTLEELLTMSINDIVALETPEETAQRLKTVREQGYSRFESRHRRKDGTMIDVEVSAHCFDAEGGQVVVFVRDVTERKRAEQALAESELKYRTLVETIPQKIFIKDSNLVYVSCNDGYAEDLGIKPEEISGHTDFDFYPADLAEKYRADDKRVIESGNPEGIEERYIEKGQEKVVETLKAPVRDGRGKVVGVLGVFHDITDRKQAEAALRESEVRYRLITENTSDSIWTLDSELRLTYQSPAAERLFGYTLEEWPSIGWKGFVHPDDLHIVMNALTGLRDGRLQDSARGTIRVRDRHGCEMWAEVVCSPLHGPGGEFGGVVGVTRDVTERMLAEQELRKYRVAVEQSAEGIAMTDMDGVISFVNDSWAAMHGRSVEEVTGRHLSVFHTRKQMETEVIPFNRRLLETGANRGEVWHVRMNGEEFPSFMTVTVLKGVGDRPFAMLALMQDITEQKAAERQRREQEIAQARAEELSESRRRIIRAQEALRRDIAGQLHGTVQNRLILLGHKLAELEAGAESDTMALELADVRQKLEELQSAHIRPISHRLFPSILRLGLCVGLEALADEYGAELSVDLQVSKQLRAREQADRRLIPDNVKLSVYRVAEEALANILKHNGAVTNVVVKLSLSDGGILRLTVSDNGTGFDRAGPATGIGLAIMSDYAAAAGGSCAVKSSPGKGTRVRAEVPIAGRQAERSPKGEPSG